MSFAETVLPWMWLYFSVCSLLGAILLPILAWPKTEKVSGEKTKIFRGLEGFQSPPWVEGELAPQHAETPPLSMDRVSAYEGGQLLTDQEAEELSQQIEIDDHERETAQSAPAKITVNIEDLEEPHVLDEIVELVTALGELDKAA